MKTIKGPALFLAQFAGDEAPFNSWDAITKWAADCGYKGVQVPSWDGRLFDLAKAAESKDYCDEFKGQAVANGVEVTELSTHLQGQLVAVHPAYDAAFDGFADPSVHGNPAARQEWAVDQVMKAISASANLGVSDHVTFSGALAWPYIYPWPQRPAGLIETAFDELAKRWRPILDHAEDNGVNICYEIHPGEDLHDGITFEMFLERVGNHTRCNMLYDPSHFVLQCLDYLDHIDIYKDRIKMFHVKDAEFNPTGKQGVYSGYQPWVDRAGRFRSLGDGQVDFAAIFSKMAANDFDGWAVVEWECCLKHPEDGAREGAQFVSDHIIRVTEKAFDDFADGGTDEAANPDNAGDLVMARIRLGMVGGGNDAFIGGVHRIASRIDDRFELVAGALSSTPEKSQASGEALGLPRIYDDFKSMAIREARLKNGIEAVSIVTPNHVHYAAAREFLKRGIHVICDKPLTSTLADAKKLVKAAESSDALFVLTHNYTGYPMVRQARAMVAGGEIGKVRVVQVEYPQDWLTVEQDFKQAEWRTDPNRSGAGGSTGDIGTHAHNLARFITGLEVESLAADLDAFVPGRRVDDNGHVMLRFEGGTKGMLWCSQVAPGNENALRIRVYGETGGLEWAQEDPNYLWHTPFGEPKRLITRNGAGAGDAAARVSRIPPGHPEGYLEGFANIYSEAADAIIAHRNGEDVSSETHFPTVHDGLRGVEFVDACVRSSQRNSAWVKL